jgi:hypothetical protein
MQRIVINASDLETIRARQSLMAGMGIDNKRPAAWTEYGYPQTVGFEQLRAAYERSGAGQGAVHRLLDKCWQSMPRIKQPKADKETPWEAKLSAALKKINGFGKLRDFDRRNMVGRYAGLIYRVRDGKPVREPMDTAVELVDILPVYEDQLRVTAWDSDLNSENFGKPTMWQYRMRRPDGVDRQGAPDKWEDIHPSRVQILAEGSVGDFFDGVPLLLAGFNALVDLEKIAGGSGESFLKNSSRALVFQYDPAASPQALQSQDGNAGKTVREIHEEQTQALNRSIDKAIVLQGAEAKTLQTAVADPEPSFRVAANLFSASVQIPFTVMFGQQTGRLASDEDKTDFNNRAASRRTNTLTPALTEFVQRMQAAGIFEAGEFEIEWPPLDAPGDGDKLALSKSMAEVNELDFKAGGDGVFDGNEIRKAAGYEERDGLEELPGEGDPDADPAADPMPAPGALPPPRQLQQVA